jgi:hypothetical protein
VTGTSSQSLQRKEGEEEEGRMAVIDEEGAHDQGEFEAWRVRGWQDA